MTPGVTLRGIWSSQRIKELKLKGHLVFGDGEKAMVQGVIYSGPGLSINAVKGDFCVRIKKDLLKITSSPGY